MNVYVIAKKNREFLDTPVFRAGQSGDEEAVAVFTTRELAAKYINDAAWSDEYEAGKLKPIQLVRWLAVAREEGTEMVVVDPDRSEHLDGSRQKVVYLDEPFAAFASQLSGLLKTSKSKGKDKMNTANQSTVSEALPQKGEHFKCDQCGMEIEIVAACQCENGRPQFVCCGRSLTPAGQSFLAETKEAFVEQMQKGMDKTRENVAWLKEKANQAKDATKAEASRDAQLLSEQYDKLKESLAEVKNSSDEAWKDLAKGCSESWQRFKAASQRAMSRYRSQD